MKGKMVFVSTIILLLAGAMGVLVVSARPEQSESPSVTGPAVFNDTPASCQEIRAGDPTAADGDYTIYPNGLEFVVYCHDMAGQPREYLSLVNTGDDYNFSQYTAGGASPGTNVRTRYEKVRLDPQTLVVDVGDTTFATSSGSLLHSGNEVTEIAYGSAVDCVNLFSSTGLGNIDLRGTAFAISDTFSLAGYEPGGEAVISGADQVVNLTGGGYCGMIGPDPVTHDGTIYPIAGDFRLNLRHSGIIYVKHNATGANDGTSWADAYNDLQDALAVAIPGSEIWVAAGIYKPGVTREATFELVDGVSIYGGFPNTGDPGFGDRNWLINVTVLSGDIGAEGNSGDNVYHVTWASNLTGPAVLDGFTITGGNANGVTSDQQSGGGINASNSELILENLIIHANSAYRSAGGIYNHNGSQTILTNITISNNSQTGLAHGYSNHGGGMSNYGADAILTGVTFSGNSSNRQGGGLSNHGGSLTLTNVVFTGNYAKSNGGGLQNHDCDAILNNVDFINNSTDLEGGGMNNTDGSPLLINVIFKDNHAQEGGGMHIQYQQANPRLTNVLFTDNTADDGGGLFIRDSQASLTNVTFSGNEATNTGGAMANIFNSDPTLINSILWGNTGMSGSQIYNDDVLSSTPVISNTLVQGSGGSASWDSSLGNDGGGNLDEDPLFVASFDGDYRLQLNSPAVDAGDNDAPGLIGVTTDLNGYPRIVGTVDMGAYESPPPVIYVDRDAAGDNNGTSWQHAFNDLQDALAWAMNGNEIWVAEGTYKPGDNRSDMYNLVYGVAMYGGFEGTEDNRDERNPNPATNNTLLSGDIGIEGDSSDNVYHVIMSVEMPHETVLDGFTITGGTAIGMRIDLQVGGGMYNSGGRPTLANLLFSENQATESGAALYNFISDPALTHVTFTNNISHHGGGGGIYSYDSDPVLTDVHFKGNSVYQRGGGMYHYGGSPTLTLVTFIDNDAGHGGGGLYLLGGSATLNDVDFVDNWGPAGGGLYNNGCEATLSKVSFIGNQASLGAGMVNAQADSTLEDVNFSSNVANDSGGGLFNSYASPVLLQVVFENNVATYDGGGTFNRFGSPRLKDVTFSENTARRGGGLFNHQGNPVLTGVTFIGNTAANDGGGMFNYFVPIEITQDPTKLINVSFLGNTAEAGSGGGLYSHKSDLAMTNVLFSGNTAPSGDGGGLAGFESSLLLTNVTMSANSAGHGGGIAHLWSNPSLQTLVVFNSIFWGNTAAIGSQLYVPGTAFPFGYAFYNNLVEGGCPDHFECYGELIDEDPLFVDADGPDNLFGSLDDNLRLQTGSPAIDKGDNLTLPNDEFDLDGDGDFDEPLPFDIHGYQRIYGDIVDMGACEWRLFYLHLPILRR